MQWVTVIIHYSVYHFHTSFTIYEIQTVCIKTYFLCWSNNLPQFVLIFLLRWTEPFHTQNSRGHFISKEQLHILNNKLTPPPINSQIPLAVVLTPHPERSIHICTHQLVSVDWQVTLSNWCCDTQSSDTTNLITLANSSYFREASHVPKTKEMPDCQESVTSHCMNSMKLVIPWHS